VVVVVEVDRDLVALAHDSPRHLWSAVLGFAHALVKTVTAGSSCSLKYGESLKR
jgi:hypothetical protein